NPYVGAIIYDEEKKEIVQYGYHEKFGENHAERNAILNCKNPEGKTLIVNLEPCCHFGKTPPCTNLIIKSKIKRVVIAHTDPNPLVQGQGIQKLKEAGIDVIEGILKNEALELNKIFIKNQAQNKPYIMTKIASTLDCKIAYNKKEPAIITNEKSRKYNQKLRSEYQAIMTGSGTVLADNPRLNVRLKNKKSPARIIFDPNNKLNFKYRVFKNDGARIILVNNSNIKTPDYIEKIPFTTFDELFKQLYSMGIYSIMIEAGQGLNSALFQAQEIDEINYFIAPKTFGRGVNFISEDITINLKNVKIKTIQDDILINAKVVKE
ncbi:bifunctional diaminohydroxyphosphoribosylaminopyrimidine deaminase/5-amino-6-(5-phosphoribosylamino)uracil reductase RibD, partial [bacterium]|nr:bifunctional diaminohydroxyphosphoribosylaminopyrimidine deaminase/5-amino-6-(5-phosphoribosylamino)uracil reductase RibD [bacterium]